jgi:hypothetical protein
MSSGGQLSSGVPECGHFWVKEQGCVEEVLTSLTLLSCETLETYLHKIRAGLFVSYAQVNHT